MTLLLAEKVQEGESDLNYIVWHNMNIADKLHDLPIFISAAMGWFRLYPDCNFQDLENELRKKRFQTHIIATPFTEDVKKFCSLRYPGKTKEDNVIQPIYKVTFSCRPVKDALKEVLEYSMNYKENFEKLKVTGSLIVKNINDIPNNDPENRKLDSKTEVPFLTLISLNQCLIRIPKNTN